MEDEVREDKLRKLRSDYRAVFGTKEGLRVFWDLMEQTSTFTPFGQQNAGAYAKEGKREIGLYILSAVGFTPDSDSLTRLIQMLKGNVNRRKS